MSSHYGSRSVPPAPPRQQLHAQQQHHHAQHHHAQQLHAQQQRYHQRTSTGYSNISEDSAMSVSSSYSAHMPEYKWPYPDSCIAERCVYLICDMQEKFEPVIPDFPQIFHATEFMARSAAALEMPIILTEQYPRGLGRTVKALKESLDDCSASYQTFEKTQFSMTTSAVMDYLNRTGRKHVLISGVEAHVCVWQTCQELVRQGFFVYALADGISSMRESDRKIALDRLRQLGVQVTTTESICYELVHDAKNPKFRDISRLVKRRQEAMCALDDDKTCK